MDRARDKLLTRSAFAENQDRIVMLADLLDQPVYALHFGRNADQPSESGPGAELLAQNPILLIHFEQANDAVELGAELGNMERLGHVVGGSDPRGFDGAFD